MWDRSKFEKDSCHPRNDRPKVNKESSAPYWESSNSEVLHLKIGRTVPTFLSDSQATEELLLDHECPQVFEELKNYLGSSPLLAKPEPEKELFLYLAISPVALAVVLVKEEAKIQWSIYYIS